MTYRYIGRLAAAVATVSLLAAAGAIPVSATTASAAQLAAAENSFGFALLKGVDSGAHGNTFVSPLSIAQAMAMLYDGAGGATRSQIAHAMRFDTLPSSGVGADSRALSAAITGADPAVELSIANALWANVGVEFRPTYRNECLRNFGATVTTLPFASPSSADTINSWVSDHTQGKIATIVSPGEIREAGAVLTDAVYFHGKWSDQFDPSRTRPGDFHLSSGTITVPMMHETDRLPVLQNDRFQAVRLPYGNGRLGMIVVLPRADVSIDSIADSLSSSTWNGWMAALSLQQATIILPRFHARYAASLDRAFASLGVTDVFDPRRADLRPMSTTPMYVSAIIHKTTLDVDEQGTVATAATGIVASPMLAVPPPLEQVVIRVDHPFLCAIQDRVTGALLFVGIIRNPQTATGS